MTIQLTLEPETEVFDEKKFDEEYIEDPNFLIAIGVCGKAVILKHLNENKWHSCYELSDIIYDLSLIEFSEEPDLYFAEVFFPAATIGSCQCGGHDCPGDCATLEWKIIQKANFLDGIQI